MVLKAFRTIALLEFIPYEEMLGPVRKELEGGTGLSKEKIKSNPVLNMGAMLVVLFALLLLIIVMLLWIKYLYPGTRVNKIMHKLKAKVFWNSILRYLLTSYLSTSLGCMFALYAMHLGI